MDSNPVVSVILTTFNRPSMLRRALESVMNQTFQNFEVIVVDDGSGDDARLVCEDFFDKRVIFIKNIENLGPCLSRNKGIDIAKGKYVTGLDDDDEFEPNRLEYLLSFTGLGYSFVTGSTIDISELKSTVLFKQAMDIELKDLMWGNCVGTQVLVEKNILSELGGFDSCLTSAQDADMWVRVIERFGAAYRDSSVLYRLHTDHELPRISTSKRKPQGLVDFFKKHSNNMTLSQRIFHIAKIRKYKGDQYLFLIAILLCFPSFYCFLYKKFMRAY